MVPISHNPAMQTQNTFDNLSAQAELLSADLAAVLESLTRLEEHDKPILQERYLSLLGELEFHLMELQIGVRSLQRRIEGIQALLNRGASVTGVEMAQLEREIEAELKTWQSSLLEKVSAIAAAGQLLSALI
jgi:hypothetical protein